MTRLLRLDAKALTGSLLALLLAGCTVGPAYQRPELAAPENHRTLTTAAEAESRKNNLNMGIAILDAGGHLVLFQRMDGVLDVGCLLLDNVHLDPVVVVNGQSFH